MKYRLQDLIDIDHFQKLQDRLNKIYSFPSSIIDTDGNILTATAWQDVCTKFHRKNKETEQLCIKSDQYISDHIHEANPAITYRCPHGLVDNATPIIIDGIHYGNFFTGQFFLEEPDLEFFRIQAEKYGFDEEAYIAAVKRVPIWTQEQLENYMFFIKGLIAVISESGMKNLKEIEHRKQIQKSEKRYRSILKAAIDGYWLTDIKGRLLEVNDAYCRMSGYSDDELLNMSISDLEAIETPEIIAEHMQTLIMKGSDRFETKHRGKDGAVFDVEVSIQFRPEDGGQCVCFLRDITDTKRAEEILRQKHEMLKNTETMAHIGSWEWDVQRDYVFWSEETFRIFGRNPAGVAPPFAEQSELYGNGDMQRLRDAVENCIKRGTSYEIELRAIRTDGELRHCISRGKPQYNENGEVIRIIGSFQDITESKKAEEALKSNYALLQIAGETAIFGGWSVDLENNICTWSDAVADIHDVPHGYAPPVQEAINFYAPEWREKITQCFSACAKDGIPYDEEMEIITQKGKRVWVRATGRAVKNEKDKIIKVQGSFQDITERKQTEEALKASEKKYQSLFENAQVALFRNRLSDGKVLEINERYAKMAGYSNTEDCMVEFNAADAWADPNGRKELLKILQENGSVSDYETEIIRKDGTNIWISFSATIFPEHGFLEGSIVDITERKRSEIQRKKLQAQLNQAQKMESVGRLAGGVAHDFNNMLGVILGHTEMALLQADENHDLHSDLKEIQTAAKRSADITKQLLAFARKQTISPRQLDLNNTVESMLNMLRRLIGEDIDLVWQPAAHIWPVKMDPSQLDQILANLCVNARDAIDGVGKITIETGRKSFDEEYCKEHAGFIPGDFILLAFSDNGCGMDKDTLDNLFEPFFTTKEVGKGTGLGLSTIYGIVKQNNGFINVYSEPGTGSTFKIYLPRLVADEDTDMTMPEKKAPIGGTETILLVEDEPSILRMTRMMLERKGYNVLSAATPSEAVEKAKTHSGSIDLLMTDVVMPEMNGRDLAEKVTAIFPEIKLLFMSGYTADVIAHQGVLDAGMAFIQKPFSMADLSEKVREVLDEAKSLAQG